MKTGLLTLAAACLAALATGCVERRVVYVPAYQPQTAGQTAPAQPGTPDNAVVVAQAPPPPQVEIVPVAPGPEYVWMPGYWSWGGGGWVWVGGHHVLRPRPHAVWVRGRWARHGRGYVWIDGRWR